MDKFNVGDWVYGSDGYERTRNSTAKSQEMRIWH